jgi:hypothetical protein
VLLYETVMLRVLRLQLLVVWNVRRRTGPHWLRVVRGWCSNSRMSPRIID